MSGPRAIDSDAPKAIHPVNQPRFFKPDEGFIPHEQRGFLPARNPLERLPEHSDLHAQFNEIARDLSLLLKAKQLRNKIETLNKQYSGTLLKLNNTQEKHLAISMLNFLSQAYVWETSGNPRNSIPAVIGRNLEMLSVSLRRFPMLTYEDYILHNWKLIDPRQGFIPENVEPIFTFTGTPDEAWFIKIHIAIEATSGKALRAVHAMQNTTNENRLIELLATIQESIAQATQILLRMKEHCHPEFFYHVLRPFLASWDEKLNVTFEGNEFIHRYKGASGAQSSILPALDKALGVKHKVDAMHQQLEAFKQYMPAEHVIFIHQLMSLDLADNNSEPLNAALKGAIDSVRGFRLAHLAAIVGRYIEGPAAKQGISMEAVMGTGGTLGNSYLGERYRNTQPPRRSRL